MILITSILSALLTLVGVLYEKITKRKSLRVIILLAVFGFIFAISEIAISKINADADKRDQDNRDSLLSQIRGFSKSALANTDTIKIALKNGNLGALGAEIHLQQVNANSENLPADVFAVQKGNYADYKNYFTPLFENHSKAPGLSKNMALKITLGKTHIYKLNFILNFLFTTNQQEFNTIKESNNYFSSNLFTLSDFESYQKNSVLFKYVFFFDDKNILLGYSDSKDLVNELSIPYLSNQQKRFDMDLQNQPTRLIKGLKSFKGSIYNASNSKAIANYLIKNKTSECVAVNANKYYKINLVDIIKID